LATLTAQAPKLKQKVNDQKHGNKVAPKDGRLTDMRPANTSGLSM